MDYRGNLYKVQVKHAAETMENGEVISFQFKTRWQSHNASGYSQNYYTKDDIDFFATYCQGNVFLVPVEECSGATKTIRFKPPKNGQVIGVNFANNYLAKEVLKNL